MTCFFLSQVLGKYTIRRLKEDVNANLPKKFDYYLLVQMYDHQQKYYEELSKNVDARARRLSLLHCCFHPDIGKQLTAFQLAGQSGQ